ncbi:MAG: DUF4132 domain-containing protein, partial [Pseudomonadota bacterium]
EQTIEKVKALLEESVDLHFESEEAAACVDAICQEYVDSGGQPFQRIKLSGLPTWDKLKTSSVTSQVEVALYCALDDEERDGPMSGDHRDYMDYIRRKDVRRAVAIQLLRVDLPFDASQIAALVFKSTQHLDPDFGVPIATILGTAERHFRGGAPEELVGLALQYMKMRMDAYEVEYWPSKKTQQIKDRIDSMLMADIDNPPPSLPAGPWAGSLETWLNSLTEKQHGNWMELLIFAASAGDKSKPSKKWLKEAKPLVSAIGRPAVEKRLNEWLSTTVPDPHEVDLSLDVLKGMIWIAELLDQDDMASAIGRFAEVCFKKIPQIGARSVKLGNACIAVLSAMKRSDAATGELVRLKTRIKYGSVRSLVERRLTDIAAQAGVTVADLEETALPEYGFGMDGQQAIEFCDTTAAIMLEDGAALLTWTGADCKPRKSPPAHVKRDFADALKALKQKVKDINIALAVQSVRLESSWAEGRTWPLDVWQKRYVEHPLRRHLTLALIWRFESADEQVDLMPAGDGLIDVDGTTIVPDSLATVRLWHPLDAKPDAVLAWRKRILDLGLTQPIKQAHREIYVLTDAERRTQVYSNRFAAHILRQHQFRALCHQRGWQYDLQGHWDSFNLPTRDVPMRGISVEFHVEIAQGDETSDFFIPMHVATDQVRFSNASGQLDLEQVPKIVFSELMRDVDLFVAVTSVANDPDWTDGGPDGQFGRYWQEHAFGDLSQTALMRKELVAEIVPKLAIADRLKIVGNFLEVQGKHHNYRIHLGSSNIQILPSNQYLCIVRAVASNRTGKVKLPFAGDSLLSIILSKAFMLVDEDKITDQTIRSQLGLGTSDTA